MYGRDGKSPRPVGRGVGHYRREVTRTAVIYRVSKVDSIWILRNLCRCISIHHTTLLKANLTLPRMPQSGTIMGFLHTYGIFQSHVTPVLISERSVRDFCYARLRGLHGDRDPGTVVDFAR
ncbi:hypothetical protein COCVIDRAFT_18769 [Bipolaris victoriae FI3]|uniref:Uncharacterized protein n=1 Tax=Bipolaris victoriae (strain FI3) TaxID=930091 RepID=W7ECW9_BIPV3|nr:hypothetical protein COCVIDRAFT_18769 [Bipolaris victoriae FI3]